MHLGVKGHALALDAATGAEVWRTKLKGSGTVILHRDEDVLYATTHGELWCLDPATGTIRWSNPLKGMGYGVVSVATTRAAQEQSSPYVPIAEEMRRQAAQAAAASS